MLPKSALDVCLVEPPDGLHAVEETAWRVHRGLADPLLIGDSEVFLHPFIGIAMHPRDGDAVEIAKHFKAKGCDIMDISAGQVVAEGKPVYGRQFQTPFSGRVRIEAGIPTMAVGNISSYADVNTILGPEAAG